MYKKSFILVSVVLFVLCIFSGFVCAADAVKGTVSNVTNTVVDGAVRLGDDVRNGIGSVENGVENALDMDNDNNQNNNANTAGTNTNATRLGTTDGYTTTRTTANAATNNNTSTLWIWLIVAIAAIVIIGLVWYYGAQNNTHRDE